MKYVRRMGLLTSANYCVKTNEKPLSQTGASWAYNLLASLGWNKIWLIVGFYTWLSQDQRWHGINAAGDGAVQSSSKVFNMSKQCAIWITQDPSHIPRWKNAEDAHRQRTHLLSKDTICLLCPSKSHSKKSCDEPQQWMCFTKPKRVHLYLCIGTRHAVYI